MVATPTLRGGSELRSPAALGEPTPVSAETDARFDERFGRGYHRLRRSSLVSRVEREDSLARRLGFRVGHLTPYRGLQQALQQRSLRSRPTCSARVPVFQRELGP